MERVCPACQCTIPRGSLDVRRQRDVPWYRLSLPKFYCPHCKAELRESITLAGWITIVLLLGIPMAIGYHFLDALKAHFVLALLIVPYLFAFRKWGFVLKSQAREDAL
jgi:hypothetical protein